MSCWGKKMCVLRLHPFRTTALYSKLSTLPSLVCSQAEMPFRKEPFFSWNQFFFFCWYVKVRRSVVFVCLCGMNTCQGSTPTAGETCQINLRHQLFHCSTFFVKFLFCPPSYLLLQKRRVWKWPTLVGLLDAHLRRKSKKVNRLRQAISAEVLALAVCEELLELSC